MFGICDRGELDGGWELAGDRIGKKKRGGGVEFGECSITLFNNVQVSSVLFFWCVFFLIKVLKK